MKHLVQKEAVEVPVIQTKVIESIHEIERIKEVPVIYEQAVPVIK